MKFGYGLVLAAVIAVGLPAAAMAQGAPVACAHEQMSAAQQDKYIAHRTKDGGTDAGAEAAEQMLTEAVARCPDFGRMTRAQRELAMTYADSALQLKVARSDVIQFGGTASAIDKVWNALTPQQRQAIVDAANAGKPQSAELESALRAAAGDMPERTFRSVIFGVIARSVMEDAQAQW